MNVIVKICIGLFCVTTGLHAQIEESTTELSRIDVIQNERNLLMDKVLEQDIQGVLEYRDKLLGREDNNYSALFLSEKLLLNYWLQEYQDIKVEVKTYRLKSIEPDNKVYPKQDYLFQKLIEKTKENRVQFTGQINNSKESQLDKNFLILALEFMISGDEHSDINQGYINNASNKFLITYPESEYENFIRNNIKYEYQPSKWGFGYGFFMGYGFFTKAMSENFTGNVLMGIDFDISYKKTTLYLDAYLGGGQISKDITIPNSNELWKSGSHANTLAGNVSLGYDLLESEKFKLTPFVGVGGIGISATEEDVDEIPDLDNAGINFAGTCNVGFNADWKFKKDTSGLVLGMNSESYWYVRLRYSYHIADFEMNNKTLDGSFHYITLGIGGFGRSLKRVK